MYDNIRFDQSSIKKKVENTIERVKLQHFEHHEKIYSKYGM